MTTAFERLAFCYEKRPSDADIDTDVLPMLRVALNSRSLMGR